jgi:hypothetical protein
MIVTACRKLLKFVSGIRLLLSPMFFHNPAFHLTFSRLEILATISEFISLDPYVSIKMSQKIEEILGRNAEI